MAEFLLDQRIEADTLPVAELPLSTLRLMRDANYPWLCWCRAAPDWRRSSTSRRRNAGS